MLNSFKKYIRQNELFDPKQSVLMAVSGGMDSVLLCHLFQQSKFSFGVAHCNFKLRGKESDDDEKFVKQLAQNFGVSFYHETFDTSTYAKKNGISIQMAARDLRYNWFEEIRKTHHYNFIAVAHHKDDEVETFFINLLRGTGIAGLHGIAPKTNQIIRPLLFTTRTEIEKYIKAHHIKYREDSSNSSDKYLRNKIRHQIIPLLKEINPQAGQTIGKDIRRIKETEQIVKTYIDGLANVLFKIKNNQKYISISEIKKLNPVHNILFELLKPFGFSGDIVEQIIRSLNGISGKQFYSETHRITKDRNQLIIEDLAEIEKTIAPVLISEKVRSIRKPVSMSFKKADSKIDLKKFQKSAIACIDYDKLKFPLLIRKWKNGDYFYPLGMKQKKKLSDFLIDKKIPRSEKEKILVLCSEDKIVWVIDQRLDHRFRITDETKNIFLVTVL
jgi:tRNA(Ile)-lysidine synthase